MNDPYHLGRYVEAQEPCFARVRAELAAGRKTSHWMWFVFPQLKGLGASAMAERFGIGSLAEARAYLAHPLLGARLRECTHLVLGVERRTAAEIFGYPDDLKFRSCVTLFARADPGERIFQDALARYFGGQPDPLTLKRLTSASGTSG